MNISEVIEKTFTEHLKQYAVSYIMYHYKYRQEAFKLLSVLIDKILNKQNTADIDLSISDSIADLNIYFYDESLNPLNQNAQIYNRYINSNIKRCEYINTYIKNNAFNAKTRNLFYGLKHYFINWLIYNTDKLYKFYYEIDDNGYEYISRYFELTDYLKVQDYPDELIYSREIDESKMIMFHQPIRYCSKCDLVSLKCYKRFGIKEFEHSVSKTEKLDDEIVNSVMCELYKFILLNLCLGIDIRTVNDSVFKILENE